MSCNICSDNYCWWDVWCDRCHGRGTVVQFAIGLGFNGALPAYSEQPCPSCYGDGFIRHFCPNYLRERDND